MTKRVKTELSASEQGWGIAVPGAFLKTHLAPNGVPLGGIALPCQVQVSLSNLVEFGATFEGHPQQTAP